MNKFSCSVGEKGVLKNFKHNGITVFTERIPFDSISFWADNCIQELAREYVTRFSAWKRVKHTQSGLSLNTLRQLYSQFNLPKPPVTANSLCTLRQYISTLITYNNKLETTLKHWEDFQMGIEKRPPETIIFKPVILEHIELAHDNYLKGKLSVESSLKKRKIYDLSII